MQGLEEKPLDRMSGLVPFCVVPLPRPRVRPKKNTSCSNDLSMQKPLFWGGALVFGGHLETQMGKLDFKHLRSVYLAQQRVILDFDMFGLKKCAKFSQKRPQRGVLCWCALFGGRLGSVSEKWALTIRHLTKQDMADASSNHSKESCKAPAG